MSALPKAAAPIENISRMSGESDLLRSFESRESSELVVAFVGPVGCGIASAVNATEEALKALGYKSVVKIKLSAFIADAVRDGRIPPYQKDGNVSDRFLRYRALQDEGMRLREKTENQAILAEYAIQRIFIERDKVKESRNQTGGGGAAKALPTERIAYLIDQVKRPEEVTLLRALYRNIFYLIGVHKNYTSRIEFLLDEGVRRDEVEQLVEIDRNENSDNGQKLDKTLHLADYFVRNDSQASKTEGVERFLRLIHGDKSLTPTRLEQGMYAAAAAGLRSACLSRQVGAAIASPNGEIVATGCNDVPKSGGGLYTAESRQFDMRCVHKEGGKCFNDEHKRMLQEAIADEIDQALAAPLPDEMELPEAEREKAIILSAKRKELLLKRIYKNTRLKDLGEFSRSVHAEMDAIVSLARAGTVGIRGFTLYTTTFPCHSCARHIVAAGIAEVYYIEPYEKSLAEDLHGDDISFESNAPVVGPGPLKVKFLHFEGIAPRRFNSVFNASGRKDQSGRFISIRNTPGKTVPEYIDSYFDFEFKAIAHLDQALLKVPPNKAV